MIVARDPLGIKPLSYAVEGPLFAAASESVALLNLGFQPESIKSLPPGQAITIADGQFRDRSSSRRARGRPIVSSSGSTSPTWPARWTAAACTCRARPWARNWPGWRDGRVPLGREHGRRARARHQQGRGRRHGLRAESPAVEGLIRNRYAGRTFIEGGDDRASKAETKYTPLREVLEGKRVFLVEDSIVRSTTMTVLLQRIRQLGGAKEIHVRVACPPIIAPCFYGIDMSTIERAVRAEVPARHGELTPEIEADMAAGPRRRFAALSAGRVHRPGHRLRREPALPGLHHRRLSHAARPAAVPDRPEPISERRGSGSHLRAPARSQKGVRTIYLTWASLFGNLPRCHDRCDRSRKG